MGEVSNGISYSRDSSGRIVTVTPQSLTSKVGFGNAGSQTSSSQVSTGPANLVYARIIYDGNAIIYFQWHDKIGATAFSTTTQHSIGYILSPATPNLLIEIPIHFKIGCAWAISSTRDSYTSSVETVAAEIQYLLV